MIRLKKNKIDRGTLCVPKKKPRRSISLRLFVKRSVGAIGCISVIFSQTAVYAQGIVVDQSTGGRTNVTASASGVPVVNIDRPNAQGLSRNLYTDFNVGSRGVILNNSGNLHVDTKLGGAITGNRNLANGSANVILNEITSSRSSRLQGFTEVAGPSASVIVANPNGISCDGCGFHNTSHGTLTTGTSIIEGGSLAGFETRSGAINVERGGLNATDVAVFDVISRQIDLDGLVEGQKVRLLAGAVETQFDPSGTVIKHKVIEDAGGGPAVAISSSTFGGVYGDRVSIVATDQGAGVNTKGRISAGSGGLVLTADGRIVANEVTSEKTVRVRSGSKSVKVKRVVAERAVYLDAANSVELDRVETNAFVEINAGTNVSFDEIAALGRVNISGQTVSGLADKPTPLADILLDSNAGKVNISSGDTVTVQADVITLARLRSDGNITLAGQSQVGVVNAQSLSDVTVTAASGEAYVGDAVSGGDVLFDAKTKFELGSIELVGAFEGAAETFAGGSVVAGGPIDIEAASLSLTMAASNRDIVLSAANDLSAGSLQSQGAIALSSAFGNVGVRQARSTGSIDISALGTIAALTLNSGVVDLSAGGRMSLGAVTATDAVGFNAPGSEHEGQADIAVSTVVSSGVIIGTGQNLNVASAQAVGAITLSAVDELTSRGELSAQGDVALAGRTAMVSKVMAEGTVSIDTDGGALIVANANALKGVDLRAQEGSIFYQELASPEAINLSADQSILLIDSSAASLVMSNSDVSFVAGNNVVADRVMARGDVLIEAGENMLGAMIAAGDTLSINSAGATIGVGQASNAVTVSADSVNADQLRALSGDLAINATETVTVSLAIAGSNLDINAGDAVSAKQLIGAGNVTVEASGIDTELTAAGVDIAQVLADGTILFPSGSAPAHVQLVALNGSVRSDVLGATGSGLLRATGGVSYDEASFGGNLSIASDGDLTRIGATRAGGNLALASDGDIVLGSDVTAAGLVAEARNVTLETAKFELGGLYLNAVETALFAGADVNSEANDQRGGDISVRAGDIRTNAGSILSADGALQLNAASVLENAGSLNADGRIELLSSDRLFNTGRIAGLGDVILGAADASGAMINANRVLQSAGSALVSEAGSITILANAQESNGTISADAGGVTMLGNSVTLGGNVSSSEDLRVIARADISSDAVITSKDGSVYLFANSVANDGTLTAADNIYLAALTDSVSGTVTRSGSVMNTGAIIGGAGLLLVAADVFDSANISSDGELFADVGRITGTGNIDLQGTLSLAADTAITVDGALSSGEAVVVYAPQLNTLTGSSVESGSGDVVFAGGADAETGALFAADRLVHDGQLKALDGSALVLATTYGGAGDVLASKDITVVSRTLNSAGDFGSQSGAIAIVAETLAVTGGITALNDIQLIGSTQLSSAADVASSTGSVYLFSNALTNSGALSASENIYLAALTDGLSGQMKRSNSVTSTGTVVGGAGLTMVAAETFSSTGLSADGTFLADVGTIAGTGDISVKDSLILAADQAITVDGALLSREGGVSLYAPNLTTTAASSVISGAGNIFLAGGADLTTGALLRAETVNQAGQISATGGHAVILSEGYSGTGAITSDKDILIDAAQMSAGGTLSGANIGLITENSIDLASLKATAAGALVVESTSGDIHLTGGHNAQRSLTAGEIELVAGNNINLTAARLEATGNQALNQAGNIILVAGNSINVDALTSTTMQGEVVTGASGPERTRIDAVRDPVGLFVVGDKFKYHNWELRWDAAVHQTTGSTLQAANNIILDAGQGNITLTAATLASGGGQLLTSDQIILRETKEGLERTNIRLTDYGNIVDCVVIIGCQTVGSYGLETVETFADETSYRTTSIQAGVTALQNPWQGANVGTGTADNTTLLNGVDQTVAALTEFAGELNDGTETSEFGTLTQSTSAIEVAEGQSAGTVGSLSYDGSANIARGGLDLGTAGPVTVDVAGAGNVAVNPADISSATNLPASTQGAEIDRYTPVLSGIPAEARSTYTDPNNLYSTQEFQETTGITRAVRSSVANTERREAEVSRYDGQTKTNIDASGSIVRSSLAGNYNIEGSNITLYAQNGIYDPGTDISTNGLVTLASVNGDIVFKPLATNSFTVSGGTAKSKKGVFGSVEATQTITKNKSWDYSNISGGAGVTINAMNGNVSLTGTNVLSENGDVNISGKSIDITSVKQVTEVSKTKQNIGLFYRMEESQKVTAEMTMAASVSGKNVYLNAQDAIDLYAVSVSAQDQLGMSAGGSISLRAASDKVTSEMSSEEAGLFVGTDFGDAPLGGLLGGEPGWISIFGGNKMAAQTQEVMVTQTALMSGGDMAITAQGSVYGEALAIIAGGDVSIAADSITLAAVKRDEYANTQSSSWSLGLSVPQIDLAGGSIGGKFGVRWDKANTEMVSAIHQGAGLSVAGNLSMQSVNDISLENVSVEAGRDITMAAGGEINIFESINTKSMTASTKSGFAGLYYSLSSPLSEAAGDVFSSLTGIATSARAAGEALAKVDDPLAAIRAAGRIADIGTGVISLRDDIKALRTQIDTLKKLGSSDSKERAKVTLLNIDLAAGVELSGTKTSMSGSTVDGSSIKAGDNLLLTSGSNILVRASELSAGNALSLDAANSITLDAGYNLTEMTSKSNSFGLKVGMVAGINGNFEPSIGEVYASVEGSTAKEAASASTAVTSSLTGRTVNLNAGGNIRSVGADIDGTDVALNAGGSIDLVSAISTASSSSSSLSGDLKVSVGIGANFTPTSLGIVANGLYQGGKANSLAHDLSKVTGTNSVSLISGGNTTLRGAVVDGGAVTGDIGGSLTVESVQDTSSSGSAKIGGGIDVTISATPEFGWNIDLAAGTANKAWVNEQSAITGSSVDLKVASNTNLVGGLIAADNGNLSLDTGSLTSSNINDNEFALDVAFNAGFTLGFDMQKSLLQNISDPSLGGGFKVIDRKQTTKSTIGGGDITVAGGAYSGGINRDIANAQVITKDFEIDASNILGDLFSIFEGAQGLQSELSR